MTTDKIFDFVRELRKDVIIPMVFMTYANVVFSYGTAAPEHIGAYVKSMKDALRQNLPFSHPYKMPPSRSLNLAGAYLLIQSSLGEILPRGSGILAAPALCKPPDKGGGQCGQAGCCARHHAGVGVAQGNGAIALGQRYAE